MSVQTGISSFSSYSGAETPGLPPQLPEDLPKPSLDAVEFLQDIRPADLKPLLFADSLVTFSDNHKELGEFSVTVTATSHRDDPECLLVHASSHGAIDNIPCGTSITAYVNSQLHTLEQTHHEYVKLENHPSDRKTIITLQEGVYVINKVVTQGQDVTRTSLTYKKEDMQGFISEGSNLLLQRLLIRKGVPADCQFVAFDSNSRLCPATYTSLDKRAQVVEDTELDVLGLERTITSTVDLPTTWQSYYTMDGQLTSRVQVGSPVTMRALVIPPTLEEDEVEAKPVFGKRDLDWEDDEEMHSKYLDRKEELKDLHIKYLTSHPELQCLLADFLQYILVRKPDDTLAASAEYFSAFSRGRPGQTPYRDSAAPTPYPHSRANSQIDYLSRT